MDRFKDRYRHEQKYLVDEREIGLLTLRLKIFMAPDEYHPDEAYRIRSVYFDDPQDCALMQNLDGISPRNKYRIRIYNEDREVIHLEQKIKNYDLTKKRSCRISGEECENLLKGRIPILKPDEERRLLVALRTEMLLHRLAPKVIVEYERTAYTCREGNVRVTFDRNLASSCNLERFWEKNLPKRPVLGCGKAVMEVKYDEFLPSYIKELLNTGKRERITFSKYVLCRKFGL